MTRILRTIAIGAALAFALPLVSCTGTGHVRVTGHVDVPAPTLVHIAPGVWVVEDYDRPVFYNDGWYWLYSDGVWLRSRTYGGSFVRVDAHVVPHAVVRIDRPRRYVRYHAPRGAKVRKAATPRARGKARHRHQKAKAHEHDRRRHDRDRRTVRRDRRYH